MSKYKDEKEGGRVAKVLHLTLLGVASKRMNEKVGLTCSRPTGSVTVMVRPAFLRTVRKVVC